MVISAAYRDKLSPPSPLQMNCSWYFELTGLPSPFHNHNTPSASATVKGRDLRLHKHIYKIVYNIVNLLRNSFV